MAGKTCAPVGIGQQSWSYGPQQQVLKNQLEENAARNGRPFQPSLEPRHRRCLRMERRGAGPADRSSRRAPSTGGSVTGRSGASGCVFSSLQTGFKLLPAKKTGV